jgi:hypothetical protein
VEAASPKEGEETQAAPEPISVPQQAPTTRKSRPPSLPTARMNGLLIGLAGGEEEGKDEMPAAMTVAVVEAGAGAAAAEAEAPWERVPTPTSFAVPLPSPSPASPYQLPAALVHSPDGGLGLPVPAKQPQEQQREQEQQAGGGVAIAAEEGANGTA